MAQSAMTEKDASLYAALGLAAVIVALTGLVFAALALSYCLMTHKAADQPSVEMGCDKERVAFANSSHFMLANKHSGNLLVVSGQVFHNFPTDRGFIRPRGFLQDSGGAVLAENEVYAGNTLSEGDLINLPVEEIQARLEDKNRADALNTNIAPGQRVGFMVVLDRLPESISSYRVEAVGSCPAK